MVRPLQSKPLGLAPPHTYGHAEVALGDADDGRVAGAARVDDRAATAAARADEPDEEPPEDEADAVC